MFHCSVIKVLKLFLCCLSTGATLISYHSFFSLSTTFFNFFISLFCSFLNCFNSELYTIICFLFCQQVFLTFFIFYFCPEIFLSFLFYVLPESFCAWFCEKIFYQLQSFLPSGKQRFAPVRCLSLLCKKTRRPWPSQKTLFYGILKCQKT